MAGSQSFSDREETVARLLLEGKSNKQIAAALNISVSTVEFHLTHLYAKLGVSSRSEAIVQLSGLGKSRGQADDNTPPQLDPGEFPVGKEGRKAENKGTTNSPVEEMPMTAQTQKPSGNNQISIWIGIVIGLVLFGGYQLILRMTNPPIEKVQVTRMVTVESTRIVRNEVTRVVMATTAPKIQMEISLGTALPVALSRHTLTRMPDGKILIVGGSSSVDVHLNTAWIFDPFTNQVYPTAAMHTARHGHSATLLEDGRVLVIGGYNLPQQWLTDAEVYDPASNTWTVIPPIYSHGVEHSATQLMDGRILVVGGCIGSGNCTNRVEIFDPQTNSWTEAAPLLSARASQTAQLLEDGRVLLAGGEWDEVDNIVDGTAVIYDPATNRWSATAPMITPRVQAKSVRLADGKVLVAGGILAGQDPPQIIASTEIYDPVINKWSSAAALNTPLYSFVLALLPNGRAVTVGGANNYENSWQANSFVSQVQMYNPLSNRWEVAGTIERPTALAAAVLLIDGRLWVTGGQFGQSEYSWESWFIQLKSH